MTDAQFRTIKAILEKISTGIGTVVFCIAWIIVLASCVAHAECAQGTYQAVNTKWNHTLIMDEGAQKKPPTLADMIDGHANCFQAAWIKKFELDGMGCKSEVLMGHIKNGQGHALLRAYDERRHEWLTMDNRPGTDGVYRTIRDFNEAR